MMGVAPVPHCCIRQRRSCPPHPAFGHLLLTEKKSAHVFPLREERVPRRGG